MIATLATKLGAMRGARRLTAAFLLGFVTILAFPPFSIAPVIWLTFPPLMWLLDGCRTRGRAAAVGWAFGFGHFATSFYWITEAFYVDADTFGIFAIPAVALLSAGMAGYIALAAFVTQFIPPPHEDDMPDDRVITMTLRVVLFAAAWTVAEWLRSWIGTGFPWNPMATVWSETRMPYGVPMLQVTTLIGTYGLSLITVFAAALPAVLGHMPRLRRAWLTAAVAPVLLLIIGVSGALRLKTTHTTFVPDIKMRLVQAAIPQAERAQQNLWAKQLQDYVQLSVTDRPDDVTHVIWGEAALPPLFFINVDENNRRRLAEAVAPPKGLFITGADRGLRGPNGELDIYNSSYVLSPSGDILGFYDKVHLVPFGEYVPLRWLIPFDKITGGVGDFMRGASRTSIPTPSLPPFSPQICYEIIFSGEVTPSGLRNDSVHPRWILNLTNDTWFGLSTGPRQHYAAARLRAVEEGLPLVRVANSGISAVIDGVGRTINELGLGQRGVLDVQLPEPPVSSTPFALLGNLIPVLLATLAGSGAFLIRLRITRSWR